MNRRGLTWVDWLVLGAIAVILYAILFPVFARWSSHGGPSTYCKSNLKLLGNALHMYAADFDDRLPPANRWRDCLQPLLKSDKVLKCPTDKRPIREAAGSYSWNGFLDGTLLESVALPAEEVAMFEADALRRNAVSRGGDYAPRHSDGGNLLYLDGHVKYFRPENHLVLAPVKLEKKQSKRGTSPAGR